MFALRRVGGLEPAARAPVVAAALQNPDEAIQRLAALSLPLLPDADRQALAPKVK